MNQSQGHSQDHPQAEKPVPSSAAVIHTAPSSLLPKGALAIARREIRSSFVTLLVYAVSAAFVFLTGFFFFSFLTQFNQVIEQSQVVPGTKTSLNLWVVTPLVDTLEIVLLFFLPILTMRLLSEERTRGTLSLLMTSPVTVTGIVVGKYLSFAFTLFVLLALSFVYPLALTFISNPEVPPALTGYLGLFLFGLSFGAIGLFISALTASQTVASIVSLAIFLFLYLIDTPAEKLGGTFGAVLTFLTPASHTENFAKGVITGGDLLYFVSCISFGLFLAARALELKRGA